MSIFKTIKFELLILALITLSIFTSFNLDLFFYSYFINLSEWVNGVFLKEFFSEITKLGSSSWYFSITIIGFVIFYINNKLQIIKTKSAKNLSYFFISSFIYILTVGIITQIIKHVVGRPRPNHTDFEDVFSFKYFYHGVKFSFFPLWTLFHHIYRLLYFGFCSSKTKIFFLFFSLNCCF